MKTIYISGAYTADTEEGIENNIEEARRVAIALWKLGAGCHTPHLNTAHFERYSIPYEQFMDFDFWMMERGFDALFLLPNWHNSKGTIRELALAEKLGIPILRSLEEAEAFLK